MHVPTPQAANRIAWLADYLALVYHEARNVRHLVRERAVEPDQWKYLIALPVNRNEAWRALQDVRAQARRADSTAAILQIFERRFRVSLAQLVSLYGNPAWRNQRFGGNAWEAIAELVEKLASSLEAGRLSNADELLHALRVARHNTGAVIDKLSRLDHGLGREPEG
jgi:hypothetical protein